MDDTNDNAILNKSNSLKGYSYLIEQIRNYMGQGLTRDKAIQASIKHCIENNVLSEFLKVYYEEVANMLNLQYDQEAEFRAIREEGREEARLETARRLFKMGLTLQQVMEGTGLDLDVVEKLKQEFLKT